MLELNRIPAEQTRAQYLKFLQIPENGTLYLD